MIDLIKSETRKLFSTKTPWWLLAGMAFFAGPGVFLAGQSTPESLSQPLHEQVWFFITAGFTRLLVLILGIRAITDEFRHGTIVPTVLAAPQRWRVVAAKSVVVAVVGVVFTLIAQVVMLAVSGALISFNGADLTLTDRTVTALIGMALAGGLWAMIGTALGTILRRQVIAVVGALMWLLPGGGIEEIIRSQFGAFADYLPGNMGMVLSLSPPKAPLATAAAVLLGFTAAAVAGGIALMRARDV